jgi:hypothetical protein
VFALSLSACADGAASASKTLGDVEVPKTFTFSTTRPVEVEVSASKAVIGRDFGALEVSRADGRVLFKGPLPADTPVLLNVSVPQKDDNINVTLIQNDVRNTAIVSVSSGRAAHAFQ